jgi:hypothetical protein
MKTNSILKYRYSAEYWNYREKENGINNEIEHYFTENIKLIMGPGTTERINFYSRYLFRPGAYIKYILDVNKNNVQPNSYWQITNIEPSLNSFGQIIGYKYKAIRKTEE